MHVSNSQALEGPPGYLLCKALTRTNLTKANLSGAYLEPTQLKNAKLNGADLTDSGPNIE